MNEAVELYWALAESAQDIDSRQPARQLGRYIFDALISLQVRSIIPHSEIPLRLGNVYCIQSAAELVGASRRICSHHHKSEGTEADFEMCPLDDDLLDVEQASARVESHVSWAQSDSAL